MDIEPSDIVDIEFVSLQQRDQYIVNQRQKGVPASELAEELALSKRQVERVYSKYTNEHIIGRREGSGRRKILSNHLKQKIQGLVRKNPYITCQDISTRLNNVVGAETIRLYLRDQGFVHKWPSSIPNLSREDMENRLEFAESYMDLEFNDTFFTDECMFTLNGCSKVWGQKGKRINKPKDVYPEKIMVWGAISVEGKAYLEVVEGIMDRFVYAELLEERFIPLADEIFEDGWKLQHDGAKAHTARLVKNLLEDNDVELLDWPARSPDLNPIENIWSILKSRVYKRKPKTVEELEDFIFEEWENLDDEMVGRVAASFTNRLEDVIERNGSAVDY